ncbi:unnamed protein product [Brassicogethes aeneus]|uniref:Transmembrane protein 59-like n=1 Tax=Brassicogethes aeneus TaxID=1431903 RepID=A0A9P0B4W6_BRAAE|nr:unnamed protein product [Brassicogethes aeneus]
MLLLALFFVVKTTSALEFFSNTFALADQCSGVCQNLNLPRLELENYEQVVCQRGCRFFNILKFKDELNINSTKKECHLSCTESYLEKKENDVCQIGCDEMSRRRLVEMTNFLILTQDDDNNAIVLAEPDLEILESEMSDPSIKSQLEIGFNIDYKIPETNIRTMPIRLSETEIVKTESSDWLDCASRKLGIPSWMLFIAILSAIFSLLCLYPKPAKDEPIVDVDIPDIKLILDPEIIIEKSDVEVCFQLPPKYSEKDENA